jgi:DNA-binding NarL/FixJ family response regulator
MTMEKLKILIADDHKIFRDGIKALLDKEKNLVVAGDVSNGNEAYEFIKSQRVDVILMDIDMSEGGGLEATVRIRKEFPEVNILVLSMHGEYNYILKMIEAGASGYILKNAGKEEMLIAIGSVASGGTYFSKEVSSKLFENIHKPSGKDQYPDNIPITKRETEILKLIAQEYSNSEIAEKLFISIRTVDTHRRNLIEKLGVKNTAGLVKYAIRKGILEDEI